MGQITLINKDQIIEICDKILEQYIPFSVRMEYSASKQKEMIASNNGLIKAMNVIIKNYSDSEETAKEIASMFAERLKDKYEGV